ncbi:MAG: elongation factor P 5-aminopentanone reductase [Acutalibacteraceae bacterium]|jgi:3-oxoacyl-[acyl-carrier protein] reductase
MNRTVWITGASRGIGRACAELFADDGDRIAVLYHKEREQAAAVVEKCRALGADAEAFGADVADRSQVFDAANRIRARFGKIDVLVNNAGIAQQKLFSDITEQDWRRMMGVNLDGAFYCTQAVLPDLIHQKHGKIVNVSSMWGICGGSCEVHYSASKAAVIGLTKALAKELGPSNIQVNCVAPGVIDTEMNGALTDEIRKELCEETPLGRIGTTKEAAQAIFFLASPAADFITGQVLSPNGGIVI